MLKFGYSRHRALGDSKRAQRQSKTTSVASVGEASRITSPSGRWVCQLGVRLLPLRTWC